MMIMTKTQWHEQWGIQRIDERKKCENDRRDKFIEHPYITNKQNTESALDRVDNNMEEYREQKKL